jgi:hypothetical protein
MESRDVDLRLRTLTGATCYDAFPPLVFRQARHEIICPPYFEAENIVQILALEKDLIPQLCAYVGRKCEGCLFDDFVDFGVKDKPQIVW